MEKTERLLLFVAVALTIVAGVFWYVNFSNTSDDTDDQQNEDNMQADPIDTSPRSIIQGFGFDFVQVDANTVQVVLNGSTENVRSAEVVVSYNNNVMDITEIVEGDVFDIYIDGQESINTEEGFVSIVGSYIGESLPTPKTSGVLATISFNTTSEEEEPYFAVVSEGSEYSSFSIVITEDEEEFTLAPSSLIF
jgi:hypothetical protein